MTVFRVSALALLLAGPAFSPALAQDFLSSVPMADMVSEIRIGGHVHDVHYAMLPFRVQEWQFDNIGDVSLDVLFHSPDIDAFRWIGSPRPEVGATVSLRGYENLFHLALTWQLPVFETPFYLEGSLGAAIHSGYLTGAPADYSNFGCRVNMYERFGIGAHISDTATATLTYEHTSNNNMCSANDGLSNFGLRVGWKF